MKGSSNPASTIGFAGLPRDESVQEDEEEEEIKTNTDGMDHLQVSASDHARERRRSIEELCRPPTPPNVSHSVKD